MRRSKNRSPLYKYGKNVYLNKLIKFLFYIIIVGALLYVMWTCFFVATFHGDTYGKSEAYVIDINANDGILNSADIVDLLYDFQSSHPQFKLMNTDTQGNTYHNFSDKIDNRNDQYLFFFYMGDIYMTFSCITEVTSHNHPLIKLYAINEGPVFRHWDRINNYKELSLKKNKMMKKKFETEILDNLGVKWRHKRLWE